MENRKIINSCLMLAADLQTPVSLSSVFDSGDLQDTGINYDSHITLLFAHDRVFEKSEINTEILKVGDLNQKKFISVLDKPRNYFDFFEYLKEERDPVPVLSLFELGNFENASGYVVLKMKPNNEWFGILSLLNKGLMKNFNIESDFVNYVPHITLAEVKSGASEKYMSSENLKLILSGSTVKLEDLILSLGEEGKTDYKVQNLTNNFNVDRFFRIRDLKREDEDLD